MSQLKIGESPIGKRTIRDYINKLKNQINNSNLQYVILNLDNPEEVTELTDILLSKTAMQYIIKNYSSRKNIIDNNGEEWALCISGFKYGARKESKREIGLLAYRIGLILAGKNGLYTTDKKLFRTHFFHDSNLIDVETMEFKKDYHEIVLNYMKTYCDHKDVHEDLNYIKEEKETRKPRFSRKSRKSKEPKKEPVELTLNKITITKKKGRQGKKKEAEEVKKQPNDNNKVNAKLSRLRELSNVKKTSSKESFIQESNFFEAP
jgi:hypothetical protein